MNYHTACGWRYTVTILFATVYVKSTETTYHSPKCDFCSWYLGSKTEFISSLDYFLPDWILQLPSWCSKNEKERTELTHKTEKIFQFYGLYFAFIHIFFPFSLSLFPYLLMVSTIEHSSPIKKNNRRLKYYR